MELSKEKFRPQLSAGDIEYIVVLCRGLQDDERAKSVLRKLTAMHARIRDGVAKPSYVATSESLAEATGLSTLASVDKSVAREELYDRWKRDPTSISVHEFEMVQTYRYENDMMSAEETNAHEIKAIGM